MDRLDLLVEKYLLFLKILAISIHPTTFQGLSALKERSTFKNVAYSNWKRSSHYRVHYLYKGYLPITDISAWSCSVRNSEVLLYTQMVCTHTHTHTSHMHKVYIGDFRFGNLQKICQIKILPKFPAIRYIVGMTLDSYSL